MNDEEIKMYDDALQFLSGAQINGSAAVRFVQVQQFLVNKIRELQAAKAPEGNTGE